MFCNSRAICVCTASFISCIRWRARAGLLAEWGYIGVFLMRREIWKYPFVYFGHEYIPLPLSRALQLYLQPQDNVSCYHHTSVAHLDLFSRTHVSVLVT